MATQREEATGRVLMAALTTAAEIDRETVMRSIAGVAAYLRKLDEATSDETSDDDPPGISIETIVWEARSAMQSMADDGLLDAVTLANMILTILTGNGSDGAEELVESSQRGELSHLAGLVKALTLRLPPQPRGK